MPPDRRQKFKKPDRDPTVPSASDTCFGCSVFVPSTIVMKMGVVYPLECFACRSTLTRSTKVIIDNKCYWSEECRETSTYGVTSLLRLLNHRPIAVAYGPRQSNNDHKRMTLFRKRWQVLVRAKSLESRMHCYTFSKTGFSTIHLASSLALSRSWPTRVMQSSQLLLISTGLDRAINTRREAQYLVSSPS